MKFATHNSTARPVFSGAINSLSVQSLLQVLYALTGSRQLAADAPSISLEVARG
jgi:hypothetical protein